MGENTKIEWADHTFNPWMGCTKVSTGCKNCYAENQMDHRWNKVQWGPGKPRVRTSEAMWRKPLQWNAEAEKTGIRPRVFSLSLGDWLDPEVPIEWLADFLALIQKTPHLNWLLVSKRPELFRERMEHVFGFETCHNPSAENGRLQLAWEWHNWSEAPANVWVLASVEDQEATKRIPHLLQIPAIVRGLSCEPLLGRVDLHAACDQYETYFCPACDTFSSAPGGYYSRCCHTDLGGVMQEEDGSVLCPTCGDDLLDEGEVPTCSACGHGDNGALLPFSEMVYQMNHDTLILDHIDWVICGGESGPNARPMHPDWARSLRDQCQAAGVPFFWKQWGGFTAVYDRDNDPDWVAVEYLKRRFPKGRWVNLEGGHGFHGERVHWMAPVGKKAAGRLLDGREWNEIPEVTHG